MARNRRDPVRCSLGCDELVSFAHPERIVRRVIGYERARGAGGTNALMLREPLDEWAHLDCARRAADGVHPRQGTFFSS